MQEPIEAYCHIGIVHPMAFPEVLQGEGPILDTLTQVALDPFFSAIEVTWIKDASVRGDAAQLLATAGMEVIFAAQPPLMQQNLSLSDPDPDQRRKAVEDRKSVV